MHTNVSVATVVGAGRRSCVMSAPDAVGGLSLNAFFHLLNTSVNAVGSSSGSH